MGYRDDHHYLCCIVTNNSSTEELVRVLQEIPRDHTCRIDMRPQPHVDTPNDRSGWLVKIQFKTEWQHDSTRATLDACADMARKTQTQERGTQGLRAFLLTPRYESDSFTDDFDLGERWERVDFVALDESNAKFLARLESSRRNGTA